MTNLRRMNVHHASLFPDLIGASQYSNLMVAEERRAYEIEQSAKRADIKLDKSDVVIFQPDPITEPEMAEVEAFASILDAHANEQVEPGRIQFIAEHLSKELVQYKVVDWAVRDSAIAKIRSMMRIALRKYGYPSSVRDDVVDAIISMLLASKKEAI